MLSEAMQDYLKSIYRLQQANGAVSTSALAKALGVAQGSATGMVKKLARLGLVRHHPYRGVLLRRSGERAALEVIRHHRLLELYLARVLGYSWDTVHAEAERLEHTISEEFEERIFLALGRPDRDPHGEPIPAKDGTIEREGHRGLVDLEVGARGVIRQVGDTNAEVLRYLGACGLVPGAIVTVVHKAPFDGPIVVKRGRNSHALGRELAVSIQVEPTTDRKG
jgi:DtxR family Mn-dependent transcriptional regulator